MLASNTIWEETLLQQYDVNFARSGSHILKVSMVTATLGFEKSESASHKKVANWEKRKNLEIEKYTEKVIDETPIGKGFKQMGTDGKKALVITGV